MKIKKITVDSRSESNDRTFDEIVSDFIQEHDVTDIKIETKLYEHPGGIGMNPSPYEISSAVIVYNEELYETQNELTSINQILGELSLGSIGVGKELGLYEVSVVGYIDYINKLDLIHQINQYMESNGEILLVTLPVDERKERVNKLKEIDIKERINNLPLITKIHNIRSTSVGVFHRDKTYVDKLCYIADFGTSVNPNKVKVYSRE